MLDIKVRLCLNIVMIDFYVKKFPRKIDFCKAVGIVPQYLNQIEDGTRPIPPKVCNKLEILFGADKKKLRPDIYGEPDGEEAA